MFSLLQFQSAASKYMTPLQFDQRQCIFTCQLYFTVNQVSLFHFDLQYKLSNQLYEIPRMFFNHRSASIGTISLVAIGKRLENTNTHQIIGKILHIHIQMYSQKVNICSKPIGQSNTNLVCSIDYVELYLLETRFLHFTFFSLCSNFCLWSRATRHCKERFCQESQEKIEK